MQTILVAVNESGAAVRAATTAADLAAALGARLVAVAVADAVPAHAEAIRAVQRRVESLGRELGIDVAVRTLLEGDDDALVEQAKAVSADLVVVVGAAERPGAMGEAAERVLLTGRVPVLVVPPEN